MSGRNPNYQVSLSFSKLYCIRCNLKVRERNPDEMRPFESLKAFKQTMFSWQKAALVFSCFKSVKEILLLDRKS